MKATINTESKKRIRKLKWSRQSEALPSYSATETAPKKVANGTLCDNGVELVTCYAFNGSGPKAFGGAVKWPVIKLRVAFEEGKEEDRAHFAEALKQFVSDYFAVSSV